MEKIYKNSSLLFIAILILAFVGFHRSYFSLFPAFDNVTTLLHFHACAVMLWFTILIAQPLLIRQNKLGAHRMVGRISYGVAAMFVASVILLERVIMVRNSPHTGAGADIRLVGNADLGYFLLFYLLAIYYRRNVAYHARFMVVTVLPFLNPSLGRLGFPGPVVALLILIGLMIYEAFNRKIFRPFVIALFAYVAIYWIFLFGIDFDAWRSFWLRLFS